MSRLLLNCDIGESFGNWTLGLDAEVMPFIDCANVACGFHAGDPSIMRKTVSLALKHGVQVGAHPAYQDLQGFGRRSMAYTPQEIQDLLHYQIGALEGICRAQGGRVSYVKPHGAMYNDMMANPAQLRAVIQAVAAYGDLPLMLLATRDNSAAQALGDEYGVILWGCARRWWPGMPKRLAKSGWCSATEGTQSNVGGGLPPIAACQSIHQ